MTVAAAIGVVSSSQTVAARETKVGGEIVASFERTAEFIATASKLIQPADIASKIPVVAEPISGAELSNPDRIPRTQGLVEIASTIAEGVFSSKFPSPVGGIDPF